MYEEYLGNQGDCWPLSLQSWQQESSRVIFCLVFAADLPCLWQETVVSTKAGRYCQYVKLMLPFFPLFFMNVIHKNPYPLFLPKYMYMCMYIYMYEWLCVCVERERKGGSGCVCMWKGWERGRAWGREEELVLVLPTIMIIFLQALFITFILSSWGTGRFPRISFNSNIIEALTTLTVCIHFRNFAILGSQVSISPSLSLGIYFTNISLLPLPNNILENTF